MVNTPGPVAPAREKQADWPSPGLKLKKIREEKGISESRVAEALHMTAHYVMALENDQYDKLPGKTFVKGYFRSYARLIGADVDDVLSCYEKYVGALQESEESEASEIRAKNAYDQNLRWMLCAAVIIIVVVGVSWWFSTNDRAAASVIADNASEVVAENAESSTADVLNNVANNVANNVSNNTIPAATAPVTAEALVATLNDSEGTRADDTDGSNDKSAPGSDAQEATAPSEQALDVAISPDGTGLPGDNAESVVASSMENPVENLVESPEPTGAVQALAFRDSADGANGGNGNGALIPEYSNERIDDHRVVQLESEGDDLLQVHFNGASWIEVDDGQNTRLYHDMLDMGDNLTIRGEAPFNILFGNATVVEVTINTRAVNLGSSIRSDNSARILLQPNER